VERSPSSIFAEALWGVKTSVELAGQVQSLGCVAVTSPRPGEGKSTVAHNLAKLFAIRGTRTLLIDGNLHDAKGRSSGLRDQKGLVDVLQDADLLTEAKVPDENLPLDVLPSGRKLPLSSSNGLLGGDGMRQLLDAARKEYGIIIVDLPSLKVASDARALSPMVDGMIIVAEAGRTPVDILGEAMQDLVSARASILGVVLNKADEGPIRKHGNLAAAYYS
jgi:succinoglycan biosynthesis transport protein ExoP